MRGGLWSQQGAAHKLVLSCHLRSSCLWVRTEVWKSHLCQLRDFGTDGLPARALQRKAMRLLQCLIKCIHPAKPYLPFEAHTCACAVNCPVRTAFSSRKHACISTPAKRRERVCLFFPFECLTHSSAGQGRHSRNEVPPDPGLWGIPPFANCPCLVFQTECNPSALWAPLFSSLLSWHQT